MPYCLRPSVYGPWSTTQYSCVRRTRRPLWPCVRKATFCSFFGPVIAKRPGVLGEQEGWLLVIFPALRVQLLGLPSFRGSLATVFLLWAVWVPSSPSPHLHPLWSAAALGGPCCPLDFGLAASHCLDSSSAFVRRLSTRRKQNTRPGGPLLARCWPCRPASEGQAWTALPLSQACGSFPAHSAPVLLRTAQCSVTPLLVIY